MKFCLVPIIFLTIACATSPKNSWKQKSNKTAEEFTKDFSKLNPELGSSFGYKEFDKFGSNPSQFSEKANLQKLKKWKHKINSELKLTSDKNIQVDLKILLDNVTLELDALQVDRDLGVIPFPKISQFVYSWLFMLVNEQSPLQRKKDAVDRFKYYMSSKGKENIVAAYWNKIKRFEDKYSKKKKTYPYVGEIKKYLKDSNAYVLGIKEMLEKSGRQDWKSEFSLFKTAVNKYDSYIRTSFLVKGREKPQLPKAMYKIYLRHVGVEGELSEMVKIGRRDYQKLYEKYKKVAKSIAKKEGIKKTDPLSVVNHLKKKLITNPEDVKNLYDKTAKRLRKILIANDIVSIPEEPLRIRLAGDAESRSTPVPHLFVPPLIDNDSIVPEFVVPTSSSGNLPFDDFSFNSAAAILTVHEGRPGHDLQFSKILENGISIVRARYAMNSVNAEGWGVYAEDLIYPFLTEKEQFIAIQMRLWRMARYFLDPLVQMGKATKKDVTTLFHRELGVSKVMAGLEYDRYAFRSPGQATSYYHGLLNIYDIKRKLIEKFGKLNDKCFHDTVLSFGLMPHKEVLTFSDSFEICSH